MYSFGIPPGTSSLARTDLTTRPEPGSLAERQQDMSDWVGVPNLADLFAMGDETAVTGEQPADWMRAALARGTPDVGVSTRRGSGFGPLSALPTRDRLPRLDTPRLDTPRRDATPLREPSTPVRGSTEPVRSVSLPGADGRPPGVRDVQHFVQRTRTSCFVDSKRMACAAVPGAQVGSASDALPATGHNSPGNRYIDRGLRAGLPMVVAVRYAGQRVTNQTPGGPGHCVVLQRGRDGVVRCFDPGTGKENKIVQVRQDAQGRYVMSGRKNYTVVAALRYTDARTSALMRGGSINSNIA